MTLGRSLYIQRMKFKIFITENNDFLSNFSAHLSLTFYSTHTDIENIVKSVNDLAHKSSIFKV